MCEQIKLRNVGERKRKKSNKEGKKKGGGGATVCVVQVVVNSCKDLQFVQLSNILECSLFFLLQQTHSVETLSSNAVSRSTTLNHAKKNYLLLLYDL